MIGLGTAATGSFAVIGILSVVAFVAAAIYLTDVRPKVKDFRSGGAGHRTWARTAHGDGLAHAPARA